MKGEVDSVKSLLAGAAAGVSSVLAGHPFDTVKIFNPGQGEITNIKSIFWSCRLR